MNKIKKVLGFIAVLAMVAGGFAAMASADITSESETKYSSATICVPDNYSTTEQFLNVLATESITIISAPRWVPRNMGFSYYSPGMEFGYSGLKTKKYTLKIWLLERSHWYCASTQICEKTITIDNTGGNDSSGIIRIPEVINIYNYHTFDWVIRLYDGTTQVDWTELYATGTYNKPPQLSLIGGKEAIRNHLLEFTMSGTDPDGDGLTYQADNLPPGASFDPENRTFSWRPTTIGNYSNIRFGVADDGEGNLYDSEYITIIAREETPVLAVSTNSLDFGNKTTSLTFSITDTGTDNMDWTITDDRGWITASPASGNTTTETDVISVTVDRTGLAPGSYNGTVTINSDGETQDVTVSMTTSNPVNITYEEKAYLHLYEIMDKYHEFFAVHTDRDSAGNHYIPSGWMGDWDDITFNDSYPTDPHSGANCIKITYSADFYENNHYIPTGWMGDGTYGTTYVKFNDSCTTNPYSGSTCIKITYSIGPKGWAGIYWQDPENNWGDKDGGYNLTGAIKLTFWARGDKGGEKVEFKVGGITGPKGDSIQPAVSTGVITLANTWQKYTIDLTGKDLSYVIGGFCWVTNRGSSIYIDNIKYEYEDKNFNVYTDAQHNGAGTYWQNPENNWGNCSAGGYNLTGATNLGFWAKGANGTEKIEFKIGGIGWNPNTDQQIALYPDSLHPAVSTGIINLTNEWKQYMINLTGKNLSQVIGGFCWVTNTTLNPNGCTFYLDDIKYNKQRLDELRFLVSYETTSTSEDKYMKNVAFTYDNALVMLAFMARGSEEDWRRAKILGDSFIYCQNHDRYFGDGRLRNAYQAGDIADYRGKTRLPGCWNDSEQKWFEDKGSVGSSTGNMAWIMIALLCYYETTGNTAYLESAEHLGDWIYNNTNDTRYYGGYTGGYEGWEANQTNPSWKSTEHNLDVYVAFMKLYSATTDSVWQSRAIHAKNFVISMWDEDHGYFWTGTKDNETINKDALPADVNTWGLMVLGNEYGAGVKWVEDNCKVTSCSEGCGFEGFDFNNDKDGVWFEGTAHMCIAYQIMNETNKSDDYISEIRKAQTSANNSNEKGIVAACHDGVTTGFDWVYNNRLHIGATSWYIFAEREYNPYWNIKTSEPIPLLFCGDLNSDGKITPADAVIVLQMAVHGKHDANADMDGDGRVSSVDALMILQAASDAPHI